MMTILLYAGIALGGLVVGIIIAAVIHNCAVAYAIGGRMW